MFIETVPFSEAIRVTIHVRGKLLFQIDVPADMTPEDLPELDGAMGQIRAYLECKRLHRERDASNRAAR